MNLRRFLLRRQWDEERTREIEAHLAHEVDDNLARGLSPQEARRQAFIRLGNPTAIREEIWKMNSLVSLEDLARDLQYALRQLVRNPGFAIVAVVTLALGIGVNTAVFGIVNGLFFSSLHIREESRVLEFGMRQRTGPWLPQLSVPEYQALAAQTRDPFSDFFAAQYGLDGLSVHGSQPDRVFTDYVTGNYFQALGVQPLLGRFFTPSEGVTPGADPYIVLSYAYWKQHFAADRGIVGRHIALDGHPVTIIGVAPRSYRGLSSFLDVQAWLPMAMIVPIENTPLADFNKQTNRNLQVYARLRPGIAPRLANAAVAVASRDIAAAHPRDEQGSAFRAFPLSAGRLIGGLDQDNVDYRISGIFLGLASLVLLLACVNVANLLLVRATVREREMVIRSALGAQRLRLIRQMLTESIFLALLGGTAGVALGFLGNRFLSSVNLQTDLPIAFDFPFDWHVLAFSIAMALIAGALVGIVPAVRLARANLNLILREGGRGIAGQGHKFRDALVSVQIGAALMLLIVAGLFTRTLAHAEHTQLGFNPDNVLTLMVDPGEVGYNNARSLDFYKTLLPRLRALPGVDSATTALSVPMGLINAGSYAVTIDGYTPPPGQPQPSISFNLIGTDYFRTLQIPLRQGRSFTDADNETSAHVAIVSEAMAQKYWPHQDPIGRRFTLPDDPQHPIAVVGVAANARYGSLTSQDLSYFYLPFLQHSAENSLQAIEIRTKGDPAAMAPAVERAIHGLTPSLPVFEVKTLHQALYSPNGLLLYQIVAWLAGLMGALGLVLAVVGVYGVLSYVVSRKTGEIGIRMALGAQRSDILAMIYRQGFWIVGIGLALGLAASFGVSHLLRSLFTVSATDPATYLSVPLLLAVIALLACYIPARRAVRTEPMEALRTE